MAHSNGRFNPPNEFSEMVWEAVLTHVSKQKTTNIIGIYNCKIFYSTYISLISSYTNIANTDNVEIYLNSGLENFIQWAGVNKDRFKSEAENFISYYSHDFIDPYVKHFSRIFYNEIKSLGSDSHLTPFFMLLFDVDSPTDEKEIYDYEYFYDCDIELSRIDEFFEIVHSNFKVINNHFDSLISNKDKLKLASWSVGKADNFIFDHDFLEKLVIKPFEEARCQICGDLTLREELSLNIEVDEGWILPMCKLCKTKNS